MTTGPTEWMRDRLWELLTWTLVKPLKISPTKFSWLLMAGMGGQLTAETLAGWSGPESGKRGWIQLVPSHWWCSPGPVLFNVFICDRDPGWTLMILWVFSNPNDSIPLESKGLRKDEHLIGPGPAGHPGAGLLRVGRELSTTL